MKFELEPSLKERILRILLDMVIVRLLARHPLSSYEINKALTKEFGVVIGPSTIYSKLDTLEKRGLIRCAKGRSGRVYSLTEQGQQIITGLPELSEDACNLTKAMLSTKLTPINKEKG